MKIEEFIGKIILENNHLNWLLTRCKSEELDGLWRNGLRCEKLLKTIMRESKNPDTIREVFHTINDISFISLSDLSKYTPGDVLEELYNKTNDPCLLFYDNFPTEKLKEIYKTNDLSKIVYFIVNNNNCPEEILRECFKLNDYNVRRTIAHNKNTPVDILEELSKDTSYHFPLLKNEKIYLKNNGVENVIRNIYELKTYSIDALSNPNCPVDILIKESKSNYSRKKIVAKNPFTPKDILIKLSRSKQPEILESLIDNPSCPEIVLLKLASHPYKIVQEKAKKRLKN